MNRTFLRIQTGRRERCTADEAASALLEQLKHERSLRPGVAHVLQRCWAVVLGHNGVLPGEDPQYIEDLLEEARKGSEQSPWALENQQPLADRAPTPAAAKQKQKRKLDAFEATAAAGTSPLNAAGHDVAAETAAAAAAGTLTSIEPFAETGVEGARRPKKKRKQAYNVATAAAAAGGGGGGHSACGTPGLQQAPQEDNQQHQQSIAQQHKNKQPQQQQDQRQHTSQPSQQQQAPSGISSHATAADQGNKSRECKKAQDAAISSGAVRDANASGMVQQHRTAHHTSHKAKNERGRRDTVQLQSQQPQWQPNSQHIGEAAAAGKTKNGKHQQPESEPAQQREQQQEAATGQKQKKRKTKKAQKQQ